MAPHSNETNRDMTTIRSFMTEDHRHCDDLFAEAEKAVAANNLDGAMSAFKLFRDATLSHFDTEEKTLFPRFETKTGIAMGPTQVMRMEHVQMRGLMDEALGALEAGDADAYLGHADTLLIMIQQHNMKEENVLYAMCDQHLAEETPELLPQLEAGLSRV